MKKLWIGCHTLACLAIGYIVGVHFPGSGEESNRRGLLRETRNPYILIIGTRAKQEPWISSQRMGSGRTEALWLPEDKIGAALERLDAWIREEMVRSYRRQK